MSHYLPLLLVSVSTNAALISDDSHMETQPRGQVDYLSHDWDEEDVWRSWRNMTRQKNEIANGMRLENASWRTWWKQRNKLKTVTPETLNWLKDSDVTWLYGPLHTAVDWTPPPKPRQDPTSVDDREPSSAHDRLDLAQRYKPILKHRSTREQLTSDIPSGLVSPRIPEHLDGISEQPAEEEDMSRPAMAHTKSDSHVMHANKAYSPRMQTERNLIALGLNPTQEQPTPALPAHSPSPSPQPIDRTNSASSSHSASPSPGGAPKDRKKSKHITFNTYVEQCIAIDKPQNPPPVIIRHSTSNVNLRREKQFSMPVRSSSQPSLNVKLPAPSQPQHSGNKWDGRTSGVRWAGNVEDEHDDSSPSSSSDEAPPFVPPVRQVKAEPWNGNKGSAIGSSDDDDYEDVWEETTTESSTSTNRDDEDEDDDDDDVLEMRSSRTSMDSAVNPRPGPIRQGSHSDSSVIGAARKRRRSSNGTVVQGGSAFGDVRSPSIVDFGAALDQSTPTLDSNHHTQTHLTIAPMAPTTLKIGWDSFGVTPPTADSKFVPTDWMEGFGDEYGEDGDYSVPTPSTVPSPGVIQQDGGGELRYVPPKHSPASNLRHDPTDSGKEEDEGEGESRVWHHEQAYFSTADADRASDEVSSSDGKTQRGNKTAPIPVVVRTPPARDAPQVDAYDYFEGPDLGEDFAAPVRNGARRSYGSKGSAPQDASDVNERQSRRLVSSDEGEERGRSRSRSRSRTPSPLNSPPTVSPTFRSANSKLSPPSRAKASSTNGPSSPWPIVSTSPPGNTSSLFDSVGSAYAGDRSDQRAREQASHSVSPPVDRSERGRQRTERQLSHSLSPPNVSRVNAAAKTAVGIRDANEARSGNPTPLNSPSINTGMTDDRNGRMSKKEADKSGKSKGAGGAEASQSPPSSPTGSAIMGRAVGMVNSAGAYFGLWRGGDGTTTTQVRSP